MAGPSLVDQLQKKFGPSIRGVHLDALDPWVEIDPASVVSVCAFLKLQAQPRFDYLNCMTVVDWLEVDPKKAAKATFEPHLDLVYHLWSTAGKVSLVLKTNLPRWKDDVPGQPPEIASVTGVWRGADWHERELFDLSGVWFTGHPNLRRILCPEDWVGFPLRKDYQMPLEYHGIRGR